MRVQVLKSDLSVVWSLLHLLGGASEVLLILPGFYYIILDVYPLVLLAKEPQQAPSHFYPPQPPVLPLGHNRDRVPYNGGSKVLN